MRRHRISKRRAVLSRRLAAASLAATIIVLAGGTSESRSSPPSWSVVRAGANSSAGEREGVAGRVRVDVRFRSPRAGTFRMSGAISDAGSLKALQRVAAGRLQVTETLVGRAGTIRIRAVTRCGMAAGTWQVLSGSGEHAGLQGGGAASGGPRCAGSRYPLRATYAGTVATPEPPPPAPIGLSGRYGGATSQREEVVLDVDQSARIVSGLHLVVMAPCEGATTPSARRVSISLAGPYAVDRDRSFSIRVESFWTGGVTGRFTSQATVEGTADVTTTATVSSTNTTYTCSASVAWHASLPPPAASPGTYCGSTHNGSAICLDVAAGGREVSRVEVGILARCLPSGEFELKLRFTGPIPIRGNLGFSQQQTSFEGLASGTASVSGLFDLDGAGASGRIVLLSAGFEHEGRRYACPSTSATWQAKRT